MSQTGHFQAVSSLSNIRTNAERKYGLCHVRKDTIYALNSEGFLTGERTETWEGLSVTRSR